MSARILIVEDDAGYARALTRSLERGGHEVIACPSAEEARLLRQPRSRPLIVSEALNVDGAGKPIEFGIARFAGERVRMVVRG